MNADPKTVQTTSIALLAKLISVTDYLGHARKQGIPAGQAIADLLQDDTAIATLAKGDGEGALRHCLRTS